ncbi:MAG: GGDEF domain-containing protein [Myxococcota bacterium]|nr:GGDEF domain-containing protein [Myxococcota bacterium]
MDSHEQARITLGEDELRFLNFLSGMVPPVPDFQRVLRRAVSEAARIVPLDAYAMAVRGERGIDLSICSVRPVEEAFLAVVRSDMLATCRNMLPEAPDVDFGADILVITTGEGAPAADRVGSAEFHRINGLALGVAGMFRADPSGFDPKEVFLFTLLTNWLASYHVLSGAYRRMEELSVTDPLTGVSNRRKFTEELEKEIERVRRYRFDLSIVLLDLDNLKQINDSQGHLAGDMVLRRVVTAVQQVTRKVDLIARWGGDEFALLLPHTSAAGAATVSQRVVEQCRASDAKWEGRPLAFTVSGGVATIRSGESAHDLLHRADGALLAAKRAGRDRLETAG